ncbi:hypothetical protein Taro_015190 [Colocasia esculenta]|uniref:Uncharacterized protein n=1 Tax=Colocasia esculenta TaxID=4460 RepID=A0A843ULM4_COLES|nr:hypothetical protein [Colocasia esculenta]
MLLELLTGCQPTDSVEFGDNNNLVGWVRQQHPRRRLADVFDPTLLRDDPSLELELPKHLKVACACLDDRPARCPTMLNVMAMFKEIRAGSTVGSAGVGTPSVDDDIAHYGVMDMSLHEEREDKYYLPAKATYVRTCVLRLGQERVGDHTQSSAKDDEQNITVFRMQFRIERERERDKDYR